VVKVFSPESGRLFHANQARIGVQIVDRDPQPTRPEIELALRLLLALSPHARDAVVRYYLRGDSEDQICDNLGLTKEKFRAVLKHLRDHFRLQHAR
jgi:hypothetical protein